VNVEAGSPIKTATACSNWSRAAVMSMSCARVCSRSVRRLLDVFLRGKPALKPGLSQFQGPFECCDSRINKSFCASKPRSVK